MKKYILQHATTEQSLLLDLVRPYNEGYAVRNGFEYITNNVRRSPERSIYWEKIAYIREMLPQLENGGLVVWEDADSLNLKDVSFESALPSGGILGMVQNRAGLNGSQLIPWYNAGVIVIMNWPIVREFFERVWIRTDITDEAAIVAELKHNGWVVGNGKTVSSLDAKWNRWANNEKFCYDAVVQSWHGTPLNMKLAAMQKFIAEI
jgi:hypothetical protein